uniref:TBC1 domain family member 24-like n=1 Tax=Saccoglossus kowalevskii TaxID=10224 RepID=A0ABM0LXB3_SACKO|nr:PREDICTED: TBC1 domain family member 24-like [Saccoglossus kowalevskii]
MTSGERTEPELAAFSRWVDVGKIRELSDTPPSLSAASTSSTTSDGKPDVILPHDVTDGKRLKRAIRSGQWPPTHTIRHKLWHEVFCNQSTVSASVYVDTAANTQGWQTHIPVFVDNDYIMTYALDSRGRSLVKKILCIIEHVHSDITCCPLLPAITSLLLHYMDEEECYSSLSKLLTSKQPKFVTQTRTAFQASILTFRDLAKKYADSAHQHINKAAESDRQVYGEWMWWIFQYLPFTHLVRVMDCYLVEGIKILYRVGLAILILYKKHVQGIQASNSQPHTLSINNFVSNIPVSPAKLLKISFNIKGLSRSTINKYQHRHESALRESSSSRKHVSIDMVTPLHVSPINSTIINHTQLQKIWQWLPHRMSVHQPQLLFTTEEHGSSLHAMFNKCEDFQPTILLIKTTTNHIFGCYLSTSWSERLNIERESTYFGTGECFVFSMVPIEKKYSWVGCHGDNISTNSSFFMRVESDAIAIGGGQCSSLAAFTINYLNPNANLSAKKYTRADQLCKDADDTIHKYKE